MREKAEKPAKRKLTRNQRKQIEAVIRQAKGDGKNHTVQDSIPFQNMFPDGLCRLEGGTFSKTIAFEDVNYRLAGPEDQRSIFESLCDFYNGYDPSIDYDALNGETVSCAATPAPHCEVLEVCKEILAAKGITLDIQEYDDYVIPNQIVEDGQVDTNYFQHQPYLDNFNAEKGTHLVTVAGIHVEPMGVYGGKQDSLAPIEG